MEYIYINSLCLQGFVVVSDVGGGGVVGGGASIVILVGGRCRIIFIGRGCAITVAAALHLRRHVVNIL